jgi:hypothetical protein
MGPVEIVFIVVIVLFGAIGVVRGWQHELGVTTMLLITLFAITFLFARDEPGRLDAVLVGLGLAEDQLVVITSLVAVVALLMVTFISYQGLGLTYPGSKKSGLLSLLIGLVNGYLLAGSLWYYLERAGWPLTNVVPPFSEFYQFFSLILPPAIFGWQFFILLAVGMLILRVVK